MRTCPGGGPGAAESAPPAIAPCLRCQTLYRSAGRHFSARPGTAPVASPDGAGAGPVGQLREVAHLIKGAALARAKRAGTPPTHWNRPAWRSPSTQTCAPTMHTFCCAHWSTTWSTDMNILVVDDEPTAREALAQVLSRCARTATHQADSAQAAPCGTGSGLPGRPGVVRRVCPIPVGSSCSTACARMPATATCP